MNRVCFPTNSNFDSPGNESAVLSCVLLDVNTFLRLKNFNKLQILNAHLQILQGDKSLTEITSGKEKIRKDSKLLKTNEGQRAKPWLRR